MNGIFQFPRSRFCSMLALLAGFQVACAGGEQSREDRAAEVQALFAADTSDSGRADQIGSVAHARLTSTGREIVVLDRHGPHIKVLDRRGHLVGSFGRAGGGPGELERPAWLAVQGDSVIAVVDQARISEFTIDGEFLASRRLPPLYLLGITDHCDGGWILFGPRHNRASPTGTRDIGHVDWNPWLLAIPRITASGSSTARDTVLYRDSVVPEEFGVWPGTHVAAGGGRFVFLRQDPRPRTFFEGDCATGEVREVAQSLEFAGPDRTEPFSGPDGRTMLQVVMDPGPRPWGMGLLSAGILVARRSQGPVGHPTVLNLIGRSDSIVVQVAESFVRLEDARPGVGAVFSTDAPWPRVVFVPESTLLAAF